MTRIHALTLCLLPIVCINFQSCTPKNTQDSPLVPAQSAQSKAIKQAAGLDADTYSVSLPQKESPLTITPKPGFKINADFPHRALLSAGESKETAITDHNEKRLIFNIPKESKLPATGVKADLSFSVCNDQMCKLYQETYQW